MAVWFSGHLLIVFSTSVPTVMCSSLAASLGTVNVSWVISYDGGRPVTAIRIGYTQAGTGGIGFEDTQAVVSPDATSAIIMRQFLATSSYAFQVNVTNKVGTSTSLCGQVTISEGKVVFVHVLSLCISFSAMQEFLLLLKYIPLSRMDPNRLT